MRVLPSTQDLQIFFHDQSELCIELIFKDEAKLWNALMLDQEENMGINESKTPPHQLSVEGFNHASFRTDNLEEDLAALLSIGAILIERPNLGVSGAWLETPNGKQLHLASHSEQEASSPNNDTKREDGPEELFAFFVT